MAENLSLLTVNEMLIKNQINTENAFSAVKAISANLHDKNNPYLQEVILRAIEQRTKFENYEPIIDDFAREIGLFPYLDPEKLNLADKIAYEFHRPDGLGQNNIVFHRVQARVYFEILDGKNIILSAPTSFGKSLVIDTIIATEKFKNIAIVLPTIALIDETRKRISKFRDRYKVITHSSQTLSDKNIFILTQERVMEIIKEVDVDFFVIDEFYKIQTTEQDTERSVVLNQAFYKLLKKGGQFYLLGPNIENINNQFFPPSVEYIFIRTDYKTVVTEKIRVKIDGDEESTLLNLCSGLTDQTLIYCASPKSANRVAKLLFDSNKFEKANQNSDAIDWLRQEYHPQWYLPTAMEYGIGIHHGKIPRAISQYAVKAFNEGNLRFLVCTSTLIEGVNTKAKNVIIYDNKIARDKFDFFTFNNICGRSGRMFQHFIGRVYLFHDPPNEELPLVDFPLFSQTEDVSEKLLMQMDSEDLSDKSRERIKNLAQNGILDINIIKENSNIDPQSQISLAREIRGNYQRLHRLLNWKTFPNAEQTQTICDLIFRHFIGKPVQLVLSAKQLAFRINRVVALKTIRAMIDAEIGNKTESEEINETIEDVLKFTRDWIQFYFPIYLMALNRIQNRIYSEFGFEPGDYSYFATQIECLFTDPLFVALDEYGLPIQTSTKIQNSLKPNGDLDNLLQQIKELQTENLDLMPFEKELLRDLKSQV